ncbi:MAG: methionyl-tRNA formyltransferase [Candidatus Zhuqueibacterota bacterium]
MKIVFLGTPEFAIPSLEMLWKSSHQVVAVVTGPDKPVGRGRKLAPTPVKMTAEALGIPALTPAKFSDSDFVAQLKQYNADLFVVVAFRILPEAIFGMPPKGTINLHSSLLPKYRGAAPINWAVINGERETGVTTFFIEEQVDTGEWILQEKTGIGASETAGDLHDRLSILGARVLLETVDRIAAGNAPRIRQVGDVTRAPKITKEICAINWSEDCLSIYNKIRGLSPYPRAYTHFMGQEFKLCTSSIESQEAVPGVVPGEILNVDKQKFTVATGRGVLAITEVQPENKRRMTSAEYLRGNPVQVGQRFG